VQVAEKMAPLIQMYMSQIPAKGLLGEVINVALTLGIYDELNTRNMSETPPLVALELLLDPRIAQRLRIDGVFEEHVRKLIKVKTQQQLEMEILEGKEQMEVKDSEFNTKKKRNWGEKAVLLFVLFEQMCFYLVESKPFDGGVFITIIISSIFLCFEPPHCSLATVVFFPKFFSLFF
jgi:hypothetical protein